MKNRKVLLNSVLAAVLCCTAGFATAADSQPLIVNAAVSGVCKFTTTNQTLAFTIDPSLAGPISGTGASVSYKCTKGTTGAAITFTDGANSLVVGARRMKLGTEFLPYTLSVTGGNVTGTGFGTGSVASALTFSSQVVATDYANLSAGTFTDTVTMAVNP